MVTVIPAVGRALIQDKVPESPEAIPGDDVWLRHLATYQKSVEVCVVLWFILSLARGGLFVFVE
jgi:hypothetical protein